MKENSKDFKYFCPIRVFRAQLGLSGQTWSGGPDLVAKIGPGTSFSSQNWSPLAKSGPPRTSFGRQTWSEGTCFGCQI